MGPFEHAPGLGWAPQRTPPSPRQAAASTRHAPSAPSRPPTSRPAARQVAQQGGGWGGAGAKARQEGRPGQRATPKLQGAEPARRAACRHRRAGSSSGRRAHLQRDFAHRPRRGQLHKPPRLLGHHGRRVHHAHVAEALLVVQLEVGLRSGGGESVGSQEAGLQRRPAQAQTRGSEARVLTASWPSCDAGCSGGAHPCGTWPAPHSLC